MSKSTLGSSDAPIVTDPYGVPVGKTAPNNPPFIVKRGKELPTGQKIFRAHNTRKREEKGEDSQVNTSHYVPEAYQSHCQENRTIERSRIRKTVAKPYAQPVLALMTEL
jgi:hypothetical protein